MFCRAARVVGFIFAKAAFVGAKTVKLPERFKVFVRFAFVSKPANVERAGLLAVSRAIVRFVAVGAADLTGACAHAPATADRCSGHPAGSRSTGI